MFGIGDCNQIINNILNEFHLIIYLFQANSIDKKNSNQFLNSTAQNPKCVDHSQHDFC